jgi:hypothetical protein
MARRLLCLCCIGGRCCVGGEGVFEGKGLGDGVVAGLGVSGCDELAYGTSVVVTKPRRRSSNVVRMLRRLGTRLSLISSFKRNKNEHQAVDSDDHDTVCTIGYCLFSYLLYV